MLLGFSVRVAADVDPSAVVFASRVAGEDWFCFEQPDRGGAALAALGAVRRLEASGPGRFTAVAGNVKINPMSCTTNQKYVQPGQFSVKTTASVVANTITVSGLAATACYGVHVDVQRNPILVP